MAIKGLGPAFVLWPAGAVKGELEQVADSLKEPQHSFLMCFQNLLCKSKQARRRASLRFRLCLCFRHQRLYSLLDRFRLSTVQDSLSPLPPVTSHPLDGDGHMPLETVSPDKVSVPMSLCGAQVHMEAVTPLFTCIKCKVFRGSVSAGCADAWLGSSDQGLGWRHLGTLKVLMREAALTWDSCGKRSTMASLSQHLLLPAN